MLRFWSIEFLLSMIFLSYVNTDDECPSPVAVNCVVSHNKTLHQDFVVFFKIWRLTELQIILHWVRVTLWLLEPWPFHPSLCVLTGCLWSQFFLFHSKSKILDYVNNLLIAFDLVSCSKFRTFILHRKIHRNVYSTFCKICIAFGDCILFYLATYC